MQDGDFLECNLLMTKEALRVDANEGWSEMVDFVSCARSVIVLECMVRVSVPENIEKEVLLLCRRRCCICFGLYHDLGVKAGQVAHLDHDSTNNDLDNLAFLCLIHHDQYDSTTSQSKGFKTGRNQTLP
jgi:hypothetical protein